MTDYYEPDQHEALVRRAALAPYDIWNLRILWATWALLGKPDTYIDFGSGSGGMVKAARECGVKAVGVDLIAENPDVIHDLRQPLDLNLKAQLVTSLEVAEHLHARDADTFCENIVKHMTKHGYLVFTAALPGQQGHNHVNCKPPVWWREKFTNAGLSYQIDFTPKMALMWTQACGSLMHLPANLQVFRYG